VRSGPSSRRRPRRQGRPLLPLATSRCVPDDRRIGTNPPQMNIIDRQRKV
jgi:hypothetical protein